MKAIIGLPEDPALPGLAAIQTAGLAGAIPALGLDERVTLLLRGYTPSSHATLEARAGDRNFAVRLYASDPAREAELHEALAANGLSGDDRGRIPPVVALDRDLRVLVLGWLEGPTATELIKQGQGWRAGELAARWLQHSASLPVKLGPVLSASRLLVRARRWAAALGAANPALGSIATALADMLAQAHPEQHTSPMRLVHGAFQTRHVLDLGDAPGVVDWQRFGQGPVELDAAMFLATLWRFMGQHAERSAQAAEAESAFLQGIVGLVDERALAWHRAAALMCLAERQAAPWRRRGDWRTHAHSLLGEATRLADRRIRPRRYWGRVPRPQSAWPKLAGFDGA